MCRLAVALLALALVGCGSGTTVGTTSSTTRATNQPKAPHYRACGRIAVTGGRMPVYAHNVGCAVAEAVARRCYTGSCFGEFPLPYNGRGEPDLPQAPASKPLGFECYQAVAPYTAGLPLLSSASGEWRPFLCYREATAPGSAPNIVQQLIGYFVLVGRGSG